MTKYGENKIIGNQSGGTGLLTVISLSIVIMATLSTTYIYLVNRSKSHSRIREAYQMNDVMTQLSKVVRKAHDYAELLGGTQSACTSSNGIWRNGLCFTQNQINNNGEICVSYVRDGETYCLSGFNRVTASHDKTQSEIVEIFAKNKSLHFESVADKWIANLDLNWTRKMQTDQARSMDILGSGSLSPLFSFILPLDKVHAYGSRRNGNGECRIFRMPCERFVEQYCSGDRVPNACIQVCSKDNAPSNCGNICENFTEENYPEFCRDDGEDEKDDGPLDIGPGGDGNPDDECNDGSADCLGGDDADSEDHFASIVSKDCSNNPNTSACQRCTTGKCYAIGVCSRFSSQCLSPEFTQYIKIIE